MPRGRRNADGSGRRLTSPQSVNAAVKAICDIMRRSNCAGALQYVPELRAWARVPSSSPSAATPEQHEISRIAFLVHPGIPWVAG